MSAFSLSSPFPIFTDTSGDPLDAGYIYVGVVNLNPETHPIQIYWDADLTQPAAQPIRTLNGYPSWNGTPARMYINGDNCSITVRNKKSDLVYYSKSVTERIPFSLISGDVPSDRVMFLQQGSNAILRTAQNKMREVVSAMDFVPIGVNTSTTDCASYIQSALNTGKDVLIEDKLTFLVNSSLIMTAENQLLLLNGKIVSGQAMPAVIKSTDLNQVGVIGFGTIDCAGLAVNGVNFIATSANPTGLICENFTVLNAAGPFSGFTGGILIVSSGGKISAFRHKNVVVRGVTIKNCADQGILVAYADGVVVENCFLENCLFHGHESVNCTNVLINSNTTNSCALSGVGVGDECLNWTISNNIIKNSGGDGSITCEFNSVFGKIVGNTISNAKTSGINISYGAAGPGPFVKMQAIICSDNVIQCDPTITNSIGINYYSSTGAGVGDGVIVSNNVINGFNFGIAYQYSNNGSIIGNSIVNLVGSNSKAIVAQMCQGVTISSNTCNSNTGDHSIQILSYAGVDSNFCNVNNNFVFSSASATKSLIYIDGTGTHCISGNRTEGSLNYVLTNAASNIVVSDNYGNLAGPDYAGSGNYLSKIGSSISTTVGVSGAAAPLPANPRGYVTCFVVGIGQVKLPYYNI